MSHTVLERLNTTQINDLAHAVSKFHYRKRKIKGERYLLQQINQQKTLSQGFILVNSQKFQEELNNVKSQLKSRSFAQTSDGQAYQQIINILEHDHLIEQYLDKDVLEEIKSKDLRNITGQSTIKGSLSHSYGLSHHSKSQLNSVKLKRKQLFMFYKKVIEAQIALRVLCTDIQESFGEDNCKVCAPKSAFDGIKSFDGALNKVTQRSNDKTLKLHTEEVSDLKDCARMTLEFKYEHQMLIAKAKIAESKEFQKVKSYQKALKDRYASAEKGSEFEKFNSSKQKSGYQDIKFFLEMPNGVIAELQLNTNEMLVAKEKEHVIYDILRETKDVTKPYSIKNPDVIKKVLHHMNEKWFNYIEKQVPSISPQVKTVRGLVEKMSQGGGVGVLVIPQEAKALNMISIGLYAQARELMDTKSMLLRNQLIG
ncbi:hypothetical protein N9R79_06110 [Vibrio sp.]|nr:hypothetical protein [Vibrio sp.]